MYNPNKESRKRSNRATAEQDHPHTTPSPPQACRDISDDIPKANYQPSVEDWMTKAATLAMSSSERRPPKAGMAPLPLVTWVITAFSEKPPVRNWQRKQAGISSQILC